MAIRFGKTRRRSGRFKSLLFALFFVVIAGVFVYLMNYFGRSTISRQQTSLENAIHRDIIQCYALEGVYPPSLDYLREHYGLTWDTQTLFVDYEPIGSNLYPDVTVRMIGGR